MATEVHHLQGRENELLLRVEGWKASCHNCNQYVEKHSRWAYETGNKLFKHQKKENDYPTRKIGGGIT